MKKRMARKNKLFDADQARKFLRESGEEFETIGRQLVKDDYAAVREIKTATELYAYIVKLSEAMLKGEITAKEANEGFKRTRALLTSAKSQKPIRR